MAALGRERFGASGCAICHGTAVAGSLDDFAERTLADGSTVRR